MCKGIFLIWTLIKQLLTKYRFHKIVPGASVWETKMNPWTSHILNRRHPYQFLTKLVKPQLHYISWLYLGHDSGKAMGYYTVVWYYLTLTQSCVEILIGTKTFLYIKCLHEKLSVHIKYFQIRSNKVNSKTAMTTDQFPKINFGFFKVSTDIASSYRLIPVNKKSYRPNK